jgi:hypothetical protein
MKHTLTKFYLLLAMFSGGATSTLRAQTTAFTYQGRLQSGSAPANGPHDFRFMLFAASDGGLIAGPVTNAAVLVSNGLFQVTLDFQSSLVALTTGGFTGEDRWLDIAVRPAGGGVFTPLTPRQRITPAPYAVTAFNALTAMSVPGLDGFSLDASDGSITDALFVDGGGEVGIGTTLPAARLHVVSAPDDEVPPRLESTGGNRFSAGWDFYHNGVGKGYVGVPDANAGIAPGELALFGGPGVKVSLWGGQIRALTTDTAGNVGIGTDTPAARLDVRGDIRLGPGGQLRATSSEENLRIVRGLVSKDGAVLRGTGFQVAHDPGRRYFITLDTPFAGSPVVTSSVEAAVSSAGGIFNGYVVVDNAAAGSIDILIYSEDSIGTVDRDFHFIAIGPR